MSVLSDPCIRALREVTTAACIEASNSSSFVQTLSWMRPLTFSSPHDLWAHVLGIVYPAIQAHAQQQAARVSLTARLPDELLVETFAHLPLWDRVRTATVCHRWRAVSLNAVAALWAIIPNLTNVDTYSALLARARDHPVTVEYVPDNLSGIPAFCDILSSNLHRLRGLRLGLPEPTSIDDIISASTRLCNALDDDAPVLESLSIYDSAGILLNTHRTLSVLANPALRSIELDSVYLSRLDVCAKSSVLRTLKVATQENYVTLSYMDLRLLASFSALESLALHLTWVDHVQVLALRSSFPPSLQHLHVEMPGKCFDPLAALDDFSRFRTLHIAFLDRDPPDFRRIASAMPFIAAETVSAAVHVMLDGLNVMTADAHGRRRVLEDLEFDAHWNTLLRNATRLRIDMYPQQVDALEGASILPALQELVLDTTTAMTSFSVPEWPLLDLPRLRTVRVLSERAGPALPSGRILDYLRRLLGSQHRLECLVLDGVELASEPGVNLDAALQAVTEHVTEVRSKTLSPDSHRVWSKSWGKLSEF